MEGVKLKDDSKRAERLSDSDTGDSLWMKRYGLSKRLKQELALVPGSVKISGRIHS